jgi:hypothetical protein
MIHCTSHRCTNKVILASFRLPAMHGDMQGAIGCREARSGAGSVTRHRLVTDPADGQVTVK